MHEIPPPRSADNRDVAACFKSKTPSSSEGHGDLNNHEIVLGVHRGPLNHFHFYGIVGPSAFFSGTLISSSAIFFLTSLPTMRGL